MMDGHWHQAVQGDSVETIATTKGHIWSTVWFHQMNRKLREIRSSPHILLSGDRVFIPALRMRKELASTGEIVSFRRNAVPSRLRMQITLRGSVIKYEPFTITLDTGDTISGELNSEGCLDVPIPALAKKGNLDIGVGQDEQKFELLLGHLDPEQEDSGALARLSNLGFSVDCTENPMTAENVNGIQNFQRMSKLVTSGELDKETLDCLVKTYGC